VPLMTKPLVSFVIVTYNRKGALRKCLDSVIAQDYEPIEIIVLDNNSSDDTDELFTEGLADPRIRYAKLSENRGVGGGRKAGTRFASGEIIMYVDDDAWLPDSISVRKVVTEFCMHIDLGILSFRIVEHCTGRVRRAYFPHKNKFLDHHKDREVSYFLGGAAAVRKEVFKDGRSFPEFFYGGEERDLAVRVLDAGFRIFYFPEVTLLHDPVHLTDGFSASFVPWSLQSKMAVAIRNFPWRFVLSHMVIWCAFYLLRTRGNVGLMMQGLYRLLAAWPSLIRERRVISRATMRRIRRLGGRLLY
jgi:glycosyltransferase involved in cell wall biosynthesis